jgi:hypothetical protein
LLRQEYLGQCSWQQQCPLPTAIKEIWTVDATVQLATTVSTAHCPPQSGRSGLSMRRCSHGRGATTLHIGNSRGFPALGSGGRIADTTSPGQIAPNIAQLTDERGQLSRNWWIQAMHAAGFLNMNNTVK